MFGTPKPEEKKAADPVADVKKEPVPAVPPKKKDDKTCVVEGCSNPKAPGQTYVCREHIRT